MVCKIQAHQGECPANDGPETKSDPPRVVSLPNAAWTTAHPPKNRDKLERGEASCRPTSLSPLGHHRPTTSSPARHLPRGVAPPCSSWCRTIIDACLSSPICPLGTSLSAGRRARRATGPRDRGRRRVPSCERERCCVIRVAKGMREEESSLVRVGHVPRGMCWIGPGNSNPCAHPNATLG